MSVCQLTYLWIFIFKRTKLTYEGVTMCKEKKNNLHFDDII